MRYKLGDVVELLRVDDKGIRRWYVGVVVSVNALSAGGRLCYKIHFEPDNPRMDGNSMQTSVYGSKLIPIEEKIADEWLRPRTLEANDGGGGKKTASQFKNSVKIRF